MFTCELSHHMSLGIFEIIGICLLERSLLEIGLLEKCLFEICLLEICLLENCFTNLFQYWLCAEHCLVRWAAITSELCKKKQW